MRCLFFAILGFCALSAGGARAQQNIGATAESHSMVSRELSGAVAPLNAGDPVFRNELVRTGEGSTAKLIFLNSTNLAMGPISRVTLDQFVYAGEVDEQKMAVNLAKGVFRFTTGALGKKAYVISTPTAAIGVRGTVLDIEARSALSRVTLVEGEALVCPRRRGVTFEQQVRNCTSAAGGAHGARCDCVELNRAGQTALVRKAGGANQARLSSTPVDFASLCVGDASLCSGGAYASAGPARIIAPALTWTGFYASLEGASAWDGTIVYIGGWNKGFGDTGPFGGANVGYNYQIGSIVVGAQAGYDFANIKGSAYSDPYAVTASINKFGSIDARAGVTVGPALVYGIGGVTFAYIHHTIEPVWSYESLGYSGMQTGWDLGVGLEWKFTNNISGFAEFRKYNWGSKSYSDYTYFNHTIDQTLDVIRIGLTYSFGGPAASVGASY